MLPLIIGVVVASVFRIIAVMILDTDGLLTHAWVDIIFWSLIGVSAALTLVNLAWECLPCRLSRLSHNRRLIERLCRNSPCAH